MELSKILYYLIGIALITFGVWGAVDVINQTKNKK
jgi:hypothetical protein